MQKAQLVKRRTPIQSLLINFLSFFLRKNIYEGGFTEPLIPSVICISLIPLSVISFELERPLFPFSTFHSPFYQLPREFLKYVIN